MPARVEEGLSSPKPGQAFVPELVSDVGQEIPASRFGRKEMRVLFGRKLEIAVDVTAVAKPEIKNRMHGIVCHRTQKLGFDRLPSHLSSPLPFRIVSTFEIRGHIFGCTRF